MDGCEQTAPSNEEELCVAQIRVGGEQIFGFRGEWLTTVVNSASLGSRLSRVEQFDALSRSTQDLSFAYVYLTICPSFLSSSAVHYASYVFLSTVVYHLSYTTSP